METALAQAKALFQKGKLEKAAEVIRSGLAVDPLNSKLQRNMARGRIPAVQSSSTSLLFILK